MGLILLRPWWLLALLPLAWLLWRLWRLPGAAEAFWHAVVDAHLRPHVLTGSQPRTRHANMVLLALMLVLAVLALAGPALQRQPQSDFRRDVVRVLLVDLSGSDLNSEQAGIKLRALLRALPDGQNALIVYAGEPYLVVPPTTDNATIARFVPELTPAVVPVPGNRPELAMRMAETVYSRSAARERQLIWLTAAGDEVATALPGLQGVRIGILRDAPGDAPALADRARRSGGMLLQMLADGDDVRQLAAAFGSHGDWHAEGAAAARSVVDLGYWLLLPLLLLAALVLRGGVLFTLPLLAISLLGVPQPVAAAELSMSSAMADLRGWVLLVSGQPQAAARIFADSHWRAAALYRAGDYALAAKLLQGRHDPESLYNYGNALARMGRYADALVAYERSLALRPDADARHNRDLMRSLLQQPNRSGQTGRPPAADTAPASQQEADRLAEQWLRSVPDEPASLLRRKLLQEQRRRETDKSANAW